MLGRCQRTNRFILFIYIFLFFYFFLEEGVSYRMIIRLDCHEHRQHHRSCKRPCTARANNVQHTGQQEWTTQRGNAKCGERERETKQDYSKLERWVGHNWPNYRHRGRCTFGWQANNLLFSSAGNQQLKQHQQQQQHANIWLLSAFDFLKKTKSGKPDFQVTTFFLVLFNFLIFFSVIRVASTNSLDGFRRFQHEDSIFIKIYTCRYVFTR